MKKIFSILILSILSILSISCVSKVDVQSVKKTDYDVMNHPSKELVELVVVDNEFHIIKDGVIIHQTYNAPIDSNYIVVHDSFIVWFVILSTLLFILILMFIWLWLI